MAGKLLKMVVSDLKEHGITPVYLLTDHIGFYERYGFRFCTMAKNAFDESSSRICIHE
ncbi:MAG: hypothetical protein PUD22_01575 [Erysipelotrichaceae bacterium]|nr:hypothetical protein [Erysipelotrichaceae bacterium]